MRRGLRYNQQTGKERIMTSPDDISRRLHRRPFVPSRIVLTDGARYDIRHPEMALLSRREIELGMREKADQPYADSIVTVDLLHVIRCEPLDATAAPATDGN